MIAAALLFMAAAQAADLTAPPTIIRKEKECVCPAAAAPADLSLRGVVVDARIVAGEDLRSYESRMATIFEVEWSSDAAVKGRTAVWHQIDAKACGLSFNYGRKYSVPVRRNASGELQTDACLMKAAPSAQ